MRQRFTLYNPGENNDGVVRSVSNNKLELVTKDDFLMEKKLTFDNDNGKYNLIKQVRITSIDEIIDNPIFNYHYLPGLNVYILPNLPENDIASFDKDVFYRQINDFLQELNIDITIDPTNYIHNLNSLYYYQSNSQIPNLTWKSWKNNDKPNSIDFVWNQDTTVIKVLEKVPNNRLLSWEMDQPYQEIGLFMVDKSITTNDDIVLSGLRVVFDPVEPEDENVFKTLFHVKPRHRYSGKTLQSIQNNGLHPIVKTDITSSPPQDDDLSECRLYYYMSLHKSVIFDKYQTSVGDLIIKNGEEDLELPEYKINMWGQEIMLEFPVDYNKSIDLTLHSRYQKPQENDKTVITLTKPLLFYGCEANDDHLLSTSPFDNKQEIGGNYELYFTNNTVFYHLQNEQGNKFNVEIPNGSSTFENINRITVVAISIGVLLILSKLIQLFTKRSAPVSSQKKTE